MNEQKKTVGALWIKESKKGDKFFSMQVEINGVKHNFVGFKNNYKEGNEKAPDYKIFVSEPRPQSKFEDAF